MPRNLIADQETTPTFGAGVFGNQLTGGILGKATSAPSSVVGSFAFFFTLPSSSTTTTVPLGSIANALWTAFASGQFSVQYASTGSLSTVGLTLNDGAIHYLVTTFDGTHTTIYVDGTQVAQGVAPSEGMGFGAAYGVGGLGDTASYSFVGTLDEVSIWSTVISPAVPVAPIPNNSAGLLALYHLEGDGTDSAGSTATPTGYTLTALSASDAVGTPDTVRAYLTPQGSVAPSTTTITLSTGSKSSTISGPITLASGASTGTATITPITNGSYSVTATHAGGGFSGGDGSCAFTATGGANLTSTPANLTPSNLQRGLLLTPSGYSYSGSTVFTISGKSDASLVVNGNAPGSLTIIPGPTTGNITISDGTNNTIVAVAGSIPVFVPPNDPTVARYGYFSTVSSSLITSIYTGGTFEFGWYGSDYLDFGMTLAGITAGVAEITIQVDGGNPIRYSGATIASNPVVRITPTYNSTTGNATHAHRAKVWVEGVNGAAGASAQFGFVGIELATGGSMLAASIDPNQITFLGDSITQGAYELDVPGQSSLGIASMAAHMAYPAIAADLLGMKAVPIGHGGASVASFAPNDLVNYIASAPVIAPAVVVSCLGTNGPGFTQSQYQGMLTQIRSAFAHAVICGVAVVGRSADLATIQAAITALGDANMFALDCSSAYQQGTSGSPADTYDQIHPNVGGHALFGSAIASGVQSHLNTLGVKVQAAGMTAVYTSAANVRFGTNRGDGTTGTLHVPPASQVLLNILIDATVGTYVPPVSTDPGSLNVVSGTMYTINGTNYTGSYAGTSSVNELVQARDARLGVSCGVTGANTIGTLHVPTVANVIAGVSVDDTVGTYAILVSVDPGPANVVNGVTYEINSIVKSGTYVSTTGLTMQQVINACTNALTNTSVVVGVNHDKAGYYLASYR